MLKKIIILLLFSWFIALSNWIYNHYQYTAWMKETEQTTKQRAQHEALQAAKEIDDTLQMVEHAARRLAEELSTGQADPTNLEARQREISTANNKIFGLGAAFKPEVVKKFYPKVQHRRPQNRQLCTSVSLADFLYAPYLRRDDLNNQNRKLVFVNDIYDYTCQPKYWYTCPLGYYPSKCPRREGEMWLEPYFGEASQQMVEEYSVPFYRVGGKARGEAPIGVVWSNMTLDDFTILLASLNVGDMGYSFILSPNGTFIAHPRSHYTERSINIKYNNELVEDSNLWMLFEMAKQTGSQSGNHRDPLSGKDAWWIFQHIPRSNWVLGMVIIKSDLKEHRHYQIRLNLSKITSLVLISLILIVILGMDGDKSFWWGTIAISIGLTVAIGSIWYLALRYPNFEKVVALSAQDKSHREEQRLSSQWDLPVEETYDSNKISSIGTILSLGQLRHLEELYRNYQSRIGNLKARSVIFLPTGVFVQSLQFLSANTVKVTGYLWQQLPLDPACQATQSDQKPFNDCLMVSPGVIFPEAERGYSLDEVYRSQVNDNLTIGWYFDVVLREDFSYEQYPFDVQNIWLRLWHKEISSNVVVLVPDIKSYPILNPATLPGVEEDLVLPDWQLEATFFNYRLHNYTTNFGLTNYSKMEQFPELHFNILVKRRFLRPFISNLMSVIVVDGILFALLLITRQELDLGFNPAVVLSTSAGLLFGVLLAHSQLRSTLSAPGMVYMENFYLIMYGALLFVAVNAYLFSSKKQFKILQWRDNLLPKLIYWPVLLSLVLGVTLKNFY